MLTFGSTALVLGLLTLVAIVATYALVALRWRSVEGAVPRQFDFLGRPCGWSGRWILLVYPSLALVFAAFMTLLLVWVLRDPQGATGVVDVDYPYTAEALAAVSALIAVKMLVVAERSIAIARKRATGLGWMFLPCVAIAVVLLVRHYS